MNRNKDNCFIQTYSGAEYHPLNPQKEEVDITDIAHSLSLICRFNGACIRFYSVGEHSLRAAKLAFELAISNGFSKKEIEQAFFLGLLHDASETYINDLTRPIKAFMSEYNQIEARNQETILAALISDKLPIEVKIKQLVKRADDILLATEKRDLMLENKNGTSWNLEEEPLEKELIPYVDSRIVENNFLYFYNNGIKAIE